MQNKFKSYNITELKEQAISMLELIIETPPELIKIKNIVA